MDYQRHANDIIARFDKGDKVMETLTQIAEKENIKTGFVSAIGAVDSATLSYYTMDSKDYKTETFNEPFEVLSLNGTLSTYENNPHQHIHLVLGREDYSTIGGHLQEATVSITLEVHIKVLEAEVTRQTNDEFGIQTLAFNEETE